MASHRILLSTSRSLDATRAWGSAMSTLVSRGHSIVQVSARQPNSLQSEFLANAYSMPRNIRDLVDRRNKVSPEALVSFDAYRGQREYPRTHATLLLMMSRVDSTGSFRSLEREVMIRQLHLEIHHALEVSRPTIAIFDVTPHEAMDYALLKVLEFRGIPTLMFQPSLVGPQVMARSSIADILPVPRKTENYSGNREAFSAVVSIADASIKRLQVGTGTPKMDAQKQKENEVGSFISRIRAIAGSVESLKTPGRDAGFALTGHGHIGPRTRRFLEILLERSLRRTLRGKIKSLPNVTQAPKNRYVLMALHYEPERSSIPEGFPFDSQLDAVVAARNLLPEDVELLVKEHFSQQAAALRGFVGRSPDFYDLVGDLPGVRMLGTQSATRRLMQNADCVVTLTGKVGIEAAFEGIPVLYLGQPWWRGLPGSRHISEVQDFEHFIATNKPDRRDVEHWLSHQVREVLIPGVSSVPPDRHTRRIAQLPTGFEELEAEGIVASFDSLASRQEA